jgi:hypothetical protein
MAEEQSTYLLLADYFFLVFHSLLILFNLMGWICPRLRKVHLVIICLTLASWTVLGFWYGWGYCPFTDWHWNILKQRGETDLPASYISYLLQRGLGLYLSDRLVDILTVGLTLIAFAASLYVNIVKGKR